MILIRSLVTLTSDLLRTVPGHAIQCKTYTEGSLMSRQGIIRSISHCEVIYEHTILYINIICVFIPD